MVDQSPASALNTTAADQVVRSETIEEPVIKTEHPQKVYETKKTIIRFHQVVWTILAIVEILLGFRVTLKALGADPFSGFATIIYALSYPFAVPFSGILRTDSTAQGAVFEWSTVLGGLVYALIAYGIMHILTFAKPITPEDAAAV